MGLGVPEMMLYGALAGGGVNLLRGKGLGGILQGAALGGAAGGLGGLAGNAIKGAEVAGAVSPVGAEVAKNAIASNVAAGVPGFTAGAVPGTIESVMGQAGADDVFRSSDYFSNIFGSPVYTGNEGLLSKIGTGANSIWDTAKANIPDYVTPQNVMGAANILSNIQPQQPQFVQGGNVRQGQTSGLNVEMGGARPIQLRRREDF